MFLIPIISNILRTFANTMSFSCRENDKQWGYNIYLFPIATQLSIRQFCQSCINFIILLLAWSIKEVSSEFK